MGYVEWCMCGTIVVPTWITESGIDTVALPLHGKHRTWPVGVLFPGASFNPYPKHDEKAKLPMSACRGITTVNRDVHRLKARAPIEVTASGISTSTSPVHPEKANSPIDVSESGNEIDTRL
jgi:hypothetical protein